MIFYAQTGLCRWRVLLEYFGEVPHSSDAGNCDNCRRAAEDARDESVAASAAASDAARRRPCVRSVPETRSACRAMATARVKLAAGDEITVEFPDGGVRTFLRGYVRRRRPSAIAMLFAADDPQAAAARARRRRDDAIPLDGVPPMSSRAGTAGADGARRRLTMP